MVAKVLLAPFWLIAAAFIGLGDTLYLSYYHLLDIIPTCAIGGCETVLSSSYATPFGVPFAYIGLFYYVCMLVLATFLAIKPLSLCFRLYVLAYAAIGLFCSICFELFQYFVIGTLCLYCGISAITTLALFAIAIWHWRATRD
ncbi:MAG: vitamin K epoxide reductase family protein [Minisyncoccia bacterium]|jgi:uncharacterized membrane protein